MPKRLSLYEYCAHREALGLAASYASVQKAVQEGKIRKNVVKEGRRYFVTNAEAADAEWAGNRAPLAHMMNLPSGTTMGRGRPKGSRTTTPEEDTPTRAESQARKEAAQAELAELELQEKRREVVQVEEVATEWFTRARQMRDAMEAIPARVVERLLAELGQVNKQARVSVRMILEDEVKGALGDLAAEVEGGDRAA